MIMYNFEPAKWRKYLILCGFGLRSFENLNDEIHRFRINDIPLLVNDIGLTLRDCPPKTKMFFVIKLVNNNAIFNLPNYRIYSMEDLAFFERDVANKKHLYHEIWYCATLMRENNSNLSIAGRLLFTNVINGYEQTVEQIWNRSPRLIDEQSETSDFIFLRASRWSWGLRYKTSLIHIPHECEIDEPLVVEQFIYAMRKIEAAREKIEVFEEYMQSFEFKSFSLEYKIINDDFKFLDWDTPNDRLVLNDTR
ncbi:hypothetical protein FACS1894208_09050 [Clostridia bacterium]|nr:hypothetical protein FACS1894208_09050 [Clostridia bacterium]